MEGIGSRRPKRILTKNKIGAIALPNIKAYEHTYQ